MKNPAVLPNLYKITTHEQKQPININNKTNLVTSAVGFISSNIVINLLDFVLFLQKKLIRVKVFPADYDFEVHKELCPKQAGDVPITFADCQPLLTDYGFKPNTSLRRD